MTLALVLRLLGMRPDCPDAEIVRQIADAGSLAAEAEALLVRRFTPRIELYGRRHLGSLSDARDLVQQVLLRVLEAIRARKLENPSALSSFVLGTCRNLSRDARRAETRQRRLTEGAAEPVSEALDQRWLEESQVLQLFGCMNRLPEREASVLRMSFWEDRPAEEIALRVGASAGNVRVIRHRALAKLAACLHAQEAS